MTVYASITKVYEGSSQPQRQDLEYERVLKLKEAGLVTQIVETWRIEIESASVNV